MKLPTFKYEKKRWGRGERIVVGVDEVGRGSWAGPIVVGAVVFRKDIVSKLEKIGLQNVRDSKLLTPKSRERLSKLIMENALYYSISEVSVEMINRHGVGKCNQYAFRKALKMLKTPQDHILVDAFHVKYLKKSSQTPIIRGDLKCFSIAAASIIAKVHRDNLMVKLHRKFPEYGFDRHKGYGTKLHQKNIKTLGLSKVHRKSFNLKVYEPIKPKPNLKV